MTDRKEEGGLGFKDLQSFNDALLAKQLWRLITKPNSLMCRVLKHKYYPKSNLFQAKIPANASWLWRSWTSARYLLQEGCWWSVGDGKSVNIWEDKWLKANHMPKPVSLKPANCPIEKVADLRNQEAEGWNRVLLEQLFNDEERNLIMQIPVSALGTKDRLVWKLEKTGQYRVSSGYEVALRSFKQSRNPAESSGAAIGNKKLWSTIWGLRVKKKVQHFIWKTIHNCLPDSHNLRMRGVKCSGVCRLCGDMEETVEHIMFHCLLAVTTWKLAPVSWDGLLPHAESMKNWWTVAAKARKEKLMQERLEITAYICWNL